jgi:hypothetical protein
MTSYVILVKQEDGAWKELGTHIPARSAKSAIRYLLDGGVEPNEAYAAVPARSWRPVTVKVETKTALKFS